MGNETNLKILYLEDDEDLLNLITLTFCDVADIEAVSNIEEAHKLLSERTFDVIILDYKLQDGTCENLLNDVKLSNNHEAKLVLFSAYEPTKELASKFDKIILKSKISNEDFLNIIMAYKTQNGSNS